MNRPVHLGVALVLGAASTLIVPGTGAGAAKVPVRNDLGTAPGDASVARAINASGLVAGNRYPGAGSVPLAFRWTTGGGMVDLGTLGGTRSNAVAVNDTGTIIGSSTTAGGAAHGFAWDTAHGLVDLGTLGTGTGATPVALNAAEVVVGQAEVSPSASHAFVWTRAGGLVDLGTLGGTDSAATAVNASGTVVGWSEIAGDATQHGFVWDSVHGMTDLTPGGFSTADVINDAGQIAGITGGHAYRREPGGSQTDLGKTAAFLGAIVAIDPAGRVVGWGFDQIEQSHGFVATPATGLVEFDTDLPLGVVEGVSPDGASIVGISGSTTPFLYRSGRGVQRLDTPTGDARADAVNNAGVVVGSVTSGGRRVAARWVPTTGKAVALGSASIVEGDVGANRTVKFAVTLSEPSTSTVSVPYLVTDSFTQRGATRGTDFVVKSGTVKFKPAAGTGLSPTTLVATAIVKDDTAVEGTETFVVSLGTPVGGSYALGPSLQTALILDQDPSPAGPTVSVGDATAWEGDSGTQHTVQVPFTLNHSAGVPTSVRVTVSNGTATSPADYKAFTRIVKFSATARQAFVAIKLTNDAVAEPDRTITVTLSSPTGGLGIGRTAGTLTILDDD